MRLPALALAIALVLVTCLPASARERPLPPKLDVEAAIAALETEPIHRAPGAVARFDEQLVRAELTSDMRVLVSPYTGPYEHGANYPTADAYQAQVYQPLREWAERSGHTLIEVVGIGVRSSEGVSATPSDLGELRQQTAYLDVTEALWSLVRRAKDADTDVRYPHDALTAPTNAQLRELTDRLRVNRLYNAPGRVNQVDLPLDRIQERTGLTLRVAAFPTLARGQPMTDYARALATEFPGDIVLVCYGRWLEVAVAGPDQAKLTSARDYAYGRFENGSFRQGSPMDDRIGTVLTRFAELRANRAFSRPQPAPFDLRERVVELAPWVLLGSAVLLAAPSLIGWHRKRAAWLRAEQASLRAAGAEAFAEVTELGELVSASQGRSAAAAAERHATATTLFERARTADAMAEVRKVAAEGKRILGAGRDQL